MPIAHNPFSITYGAFEVGGVVGGSGTTSQYLLHGPYLIEKSPEYLRLTFDVVVVGSSYEDLQDLCSTLETSYAARNANIIINLDQGNTDAKWTYTDGTTIGNSFGTVRKSGNPDSDRGFSRMYTVTLEGQLPLDDSGLKEFEVTVSEEPSKQKIVTLTGVYQTASAYSAYQSDRDSSDPSVLSGIDSTYSWELVKEDSTHDRRDYNCRFIRQYAQLLAKQTTSTTDSNKIVDHRITFTEQAPAIGDTRSRIYELHRVIANFDCAFDINHVSPTQTGNMQSTFENTVRPHLLGVFQKTFKPQTFAIEDQQASYDETLNRFSCTLTIVFQAKGGGQIVKVDQSLQYRESRTIDSTPVHNGKEFDAYTNPGWAIRERVWTRTVVVLGSQSPMNRIGSYSSVGIAGDFDSVVGAEKVSFIGGPGLNSKGWNIVSNESEATPTYIGLPGVSKAKQILVTRLRETVVERFSERPSGKSKVTTP